MSSWKLDLALCMILHRLLKQNLQRNKILCYVVKEFSQYSWSLRSLARRLQFFGIRYFNCSIQLEDVKKAVAHNLKHGTGKALGYRGMHEKVRYQYGLNVLRNLVYAAMSNLDPEDLKSRQPGSKKAHPKGHLTCKGPNWVHSLDGHCKLMGI